MPGGIRIRKESERRPVGLPAGRIQDAVARLLRVCSTLLLALAGQFALGAEVVFGSFVQRESAEALRSRVESDLAVDAAIAAIEVGGVPHLRVVVKGLDSESGARALIAKARRTGFPDAWYLATPAGGPAGLDVADGTRSDGESPGPADATASPAGISVATDAPRLDEYATAEARVAAHDQPAGQSGDTFDGTLIFAVAGDDGAIDVPRYDSVDLRLDGRLDEALWAEVPGHDNMVLVEPGTLAEARHRTVARYFSTENGLYIGVWNEQPRRTLVPRRDSRQEDHDAWGITLDTSGDGLRGHWFKIALGTAADATEAPVRTRVPGEPGWHYATVALRDGWSLEAFLPWSALSLPAVAGDHRVGVYVHRTVAYLNERWGWPASLTPARNTSGR